LSINGIAAFYSWPSKGKLTGYMADEATVEASEDYLHEFLEFIAEKKKDMGASTIHIIAHSMGNRGLLRALNRLETEKKDKKLFGKIFLAAPDVDSDVFKSLAKVYPKIASGTTLYVSHKDIAMKGEAEFIHQDFRVGYHPITIMDGIETVSFEGETDLLTFGHLYYTDPVVLCHLYEEIHGVAPTSPGCKKMSKRDEKMGERKYTVIK
jgi:esterase/lipase superfamily enzyme